MRAESALLSSLLGNMGPAYARRGVMLLLLLSAALLGALLLHVSAAEAQAPSKPAAAQIVTLHLGAYLFWHESSGADGYEIQTRSQTGGTWGSWSSISYTGTTQPATVTGLTAGTKYQWRIRATSGSEQSEWSVHSDDDDVAYTWTARAFGANTANPAVLKSAERGDPGEVTVTWTHGLARSGVTITGWIVDYRLFTGNVNDPASSTELLPASATMATVTGLTGGESYEFWVRAYVGTTKGHPSNVLTVETQTGTTPVQSSDATLRALSVSAGSISPAFSSTTYAYTVSVASGVTSTTVTPTVNHSAATVTVNGTVVTSGSPSGPIALAVGDNVITVRVTAENGDTQDYTVTITRQSANANLSALSASSATSESATYSRQTLAPAFDVGTTAYTVRVDFDLTHAKVTPTVADTDATVRVGKRGATLATVASGADSGPIALAVGDNEIVVRVTAEDPSITRDYTVTITRQPRNAGDGAPSAPSGLTVMPGSHSLSVFWTAPGRSVQGYDVHYTSMSAGDLADDAEIGAYVHPSGRYSLPENPYPYLGWVRLSHGYLAEPKYSVGYLQPGQQYRFRVRAYDRFGVGPWAVGSGVPWQAARTVSLSATPERVREGDEVTITATVRYNGRPSPIQEDMDVLVRVHLGTAEAGDVGTLERISIDKYTDRASVTIQTNRDSDGDDEKFAVLIRSIPKRSLARAGDPDIVWVTITEGDPAPPEPVVWVPQLRASGGDGALRLTWSETAATAHSGYDVEYKRSSAPDRAAAGGDPETGWVDAGHSGKQRSLTIGGLTNWVAYDVRVRLAFSDGTGGWSEVVSATPEAAVELGEPRAVTVTVSDTAAEEGDAVTVTATLDEPAPREGATVWFWAYGDTVGGTVARAQTGGDYRWDPPDPGITSYHSGVGRDVTSTDDAKSAPIRVEPGRTTVTAQLEVVLNQWTGRRTADDGTGHWIYAPVQEPAEGIGVYATAHVPDADHKHGRWALRSPTVTMTIYDQGQSPTVSGSQDAPPDQQAAPLPASVTLSLDTATVSESAGAVTVTATLDAPATQGGIGGFLTAGAAGTATADVDFAMPLSIFIPDGQRSAAATISITDDDIDEADETVVISALFDVGTALLEDTVTLTITDDDTAATANVSVTDTTSQDPQQDPPGLPPIAARYDTNNDGAIDGTEYQQVKNDWLTAKITYAQFLEVVKIHLKSG